MLGDKRRILVLGSPGAGKTTFAVKLGEKLGLPVVHLDRLYWREGWVTADSEEFYAKLGQALAAEAWVLDGNYASTLEMRLQRADAVVYLDCSRLCCMWGVMSRAVKNFGRVRPDMPEGCPERISPEFFAYTWRFRADQRVQVLEQIEKSGVSAVILKNRRQARRLLVQLTGETEVI